MHGFKSLHLWVRLWGQEHDVSTVYMFKSNLIFIALNCQGTCSFFLSLCWWGSVVSQRILWLACLQLEGIAEVMLSLSVGFKKHHLKQSTSVLPLWKYWRTEEGGDAERADSRAYPHRLQSWKKKVKCFRTLIELVVFQVTTLRVGGQAAICCWLGWVW